MAVRGSGLERNGRAISAIAALILGNGCSMARGGDLSPPEPPVQAPARDPDIAVREEFEQAARTATIDAWRLFLARHPDHALAAPAKAKLAALEAAQRSKD